MNPPQDKCPKCGAELAEGLCPQCLLLAGMETTPSMMGRAWTPPAPEELQAQLAQYTVLELLGHGGMAAVYKGWQNSLERHVAIKVLPPARTAEDLQFTERFKHEATTLARLNHPGIVSVIDFGETADGLLYIVMEFIEGTDVHQMISSQGRLKPDYALAIAMNVCDALAYAHENGIIHRDIKPGNVMVNTQGRVKVADFGLAKATQAGATLLTGTNVAMGTPDFIAPEALAVGVDVDRRADLYSLGVMLYQMLTGKVPRGMCEEPSVRVPGLDFRFDAIVRRAMHEDREERYQSAQELGADLAKIHTVPLPQFGRQPAAAAASPKQPSLESPQSTAPEPAKSKPPVALVGLAAAAVCAIGLSVWKPWARNTGGSAVGVAGVSPGSPNNEREAGGSKTQGSSSKVPGAVAKPSEKPAVPQGAATTPATSGPEKTPRAESSSRGNEAQTSPAAPGAPKPSESLVTSAATNTQEKSDASAAKLETPNPPPVPTPRSGDTPVAGGSASDSVATPGSAPVAPVLATGVSPLLVAAATAAAAPVAASPSLPVSTSPPLPPELATLDEQFQKLQSERVTAPFDADAAKLITGYIGGLEREMAKEKAAGHLDGILALEAEKKLIGDKQPMPGLEDETASENKTPDALKRLRAIYREAHAKLEAQRAGNLKLLTDPLAIRLQALESDLTKKDRIADAKVVREYRESLGSALEEATSAQSGAGLTAGEPKAKPQAGKPVLPSLGGALKDGFTNTLGMKFMHVTGTKVLFCIHPTRRRDYAAYAAEAAGANGLWKTQKRDDIAVSDKDDDPVAGVNWEDANAFCAWLSKKEGRTYRLPTDREWSFAVGIGRDEKVTKDTTPESLSEKIPNLYPWGTQWPPPKGAGNFADTSFKEKFPGKDVIADYQDGFPTTSPVLSFKPNKFGLYDMSGNLRQWCEDWYDAAKTKRVLRGISWDRSSRYNLFSSHRGHYSPELRGEDRGFRVVVAEAGSAAPAPQTVLAPPTGVAPATKPITPAVGAGALKDGFTNTLGMKFMHVTGTKVLFCIHETRYKDYAAYAAEVPGVDGSWKLQAAYGFTVTENKDEHPVWKVSWDDAQGFCAWLGKKEGKTYRLPTDKEWSLAVGIGRDEKWIKDTTPATVFKNQNEFPWGNKWPPPKGSGSYSDQSRKEKARSGTGEYLDDNDGFPLTAPVMSFKPNKFGLYDLGGNVWEWCEDWYDNARKERVSRGGSFANGERNRLLSSSRYQLTPDTRIVGNGFRCVVVVSSAP